MDVRYYVAEAITGDIVPGLELPLTDATFTRRLPGGTFSATLDLSLDAKEYQPVQSAIDYYTQLMWMLRSGNYTICPVVNGVSIGEWIIWSMEAEDVTASVTLTGMEWGLYPNYRALERDYVYASRDQGILFGEMMTDCMKIGQAVDIFTPLATHGKNVSIDQRTATAYYGDVFERQIPGVEWFVWARLDDAARPTKVRRDVIMSNGVRAIRQNAILTSPPLGVPGGSLLSWKRGNDMGKAATNLTGFGRGQGDVQPRASRYNPNMGSDRLITTKYATYSEIEDQATLQARVDADAYLAERPDVPVQATVNLDDFPTYPIITDAFEVAIEPRPTYPKGHYLWYRIGQTTIRPSGDRPVVDLLLQPIEEA